MTIPTGNPPNANHDMAHGAIIIMIGYQYKKNEEKNNVVKSVCCTIIKHSAKVNACYRDRNLEYMLSWL